MSDHTRWEVLQPYKLGDMSLPNRGVMSPLTRSRSSDEGVPPERMRSGPSLAETLMNIVMVEDLSDIRIGQA